MSVPAAYLAVVLIWSTTPLAVKWSADGAGFLLGALARMGLAAALCLALVVALRVGLPWHREARRAYATGALGGYGAMLCVYWAAQYVPSGLISVLVGLSPLVTALLAGPLLGERALSPAKLAGMAFGLAGLATIFGAGAALGPQVVAGLAVLCLGVVLHSLGLVLMKRHRGGLPSLTLTSGTLLVITPLYLLTWLVFDPRVPADVPPRALASIVYLGIVGSVVAFTLFFYMIRHVSAASLALITLVTPVLALLLGAAIEHEPIGPRVWAGTALVLAGLAMSQWGGRLTRRLPVRAE